MDDPRSLRTLIASDKVGVGEDAGPNNVKPAASNVEFERTTIRGKKLDNGQENMK